MDERQQLARRQRLELRALPQHLGQHAVAQHLVGEPDQRELGDEPRGARAQSRRRTRSGPSRPPVGEPRLAVPPQRLRVQVAPRMNSTRTAGSETARARLRPRRAALRWPPPLPFRGLSAGGARRRSCSSWSSSLSSTCVAWRGARARNSVKRELPEDSSRTLGWSSERRNWCSKARKSCPPKPRRDRTRAAPCAAADGPALPCPARSDTSRAPRRAPRPSSAARARAPRAARARRASTATASR
jgi:hypothetical protein